MTTLQSMARPASAVAWPAVLIVYVAALLQGMTLSAFQRCAARTAVVKPIEERDMLFHMAATWESRAQARGKQLAKNRTPVEE